MIFTNECESFLGNYILKSAKDIVQYKYLTEESKVEMTKELVQSIYENSINKSLTLNFAELEKSKGNLEEIENYAVLKGCIDLLQSIQLKMKEKIEGLDVIREAHKNILSYKSDFETGYKLRNQHVILLYNSITVALVCSVSFLIVTITEYIKDPAGNYLAHMKNVTGIYKEYPTVFMGSLERFNKICKSGALSKFFKILYSKKSLVESSDKSLTRLSEISPLGIGALLFSGISTAIIIIPVIRELIYQYYYMRVRIADYLRMQANFLEINRINLEKSKSPDSANIAKRQKEVMDSFIRMAERIDVDQKVSSQEAEREIKTEDKEMEIVKQSPTNGRSQMAITHGNVL
jgi:hypothetical protein